MKIYKSKENTFGHGYGFGVLLFLLNSFNFPSLNPFSFILEIFACFILYLLRKSLYIYYY